MPTLALLESRLAALQKQHLTRHLSPVTGIDLTSSDYLGFAQDPELRRRWMMRLNDMPTGAAGSRLLRGNLALYEATESLLAQFVQREAAVLFPSGYQANVALLSALLTDEDLVFSDALNHASLIDGLRLSKAQKIVYPHNDTAFLEHALHSQISKGLKVIVTESLFSMEGDCAPLKALADLANRYQALLIVDEAHSTGVWGTSTVASEKLHDRVFATVHTGGKALGAGGAWIAGSHLLKEILVNFARPFLFSTAPLPALALLLQEAVRYYGEVGAVRAEEVRHHARGLRQRLGERALGAPDSPILPLLIGDNAAALKLAQQLQTQGWDVRAIRPPTVPEGTARLRITVKWENSQEELEKFVTAFSSIRGVF